VRDGGAAPAGWWGAMVVAHGGGPWWGSMAGRRGYLLVGDEAVGELRSAGTRLAALFLDDAAGAAQQEDDESGDTPVEIDVVPSCHVTM